MIVALMGLLFSGCMPHKPVSTTLHPISFTHDWTTLQSDSDYRVRLLVNQLLLEHSDGVAYQQIVQRAWQDDNAFVLQKLREALVAKSDISALRMGWEASLDDEQKCQLALAIHHLSTDKSIGKWPVHSTGTLEDQFICAIAASHMLAIHSQLEVLLKDGQYPLSLGIVDALRDYGTAETLQGLREGLEYAEEGMRASLWAVWSIHDPVQLPKLQETMTAFSTLECLDMVDVTKGSDLESSSHLLTVLQKRKGLCAQWSKAVQVGKNQRSLSVLNPFLEVHSDPILIAGALEILADYDFESERQKEKYTAKVAALLSFDLRGDVLLQVLQTLHRLGMESVREEIQQFRHDPLFESHSSSKYMALFIDIALNLHAE